MTELESVQFLIEECKAMLLLAMMESTKDYKNSPKKKRLLKNC